MIIIEILLSIALLLIISQSATIFHEFGHAIPALIFSKAKVSITFGTNNVKKIIKIGKLKIELRSFSPFIGFVNWNTDKMTKTQNIIATAGGPIVSLIVTISLLIFSGVTSKFILKRIIVWSANYNLYLFIVTSIPVFYPKWWGSYGGCSSDGYKVLQLIKNT